MRLIVGVLAAVGLFAYAVSAETPVGALEGRVTASDTGRPLAGIWVHARPGTPLTGSDTRRTKTDSAGRFRLSRLAAGDYEVQPSTEVYENPALPVAVAEGKVAGADMRLEPHEPFLNLNIHQHNYLPGEDPKIALHGFRQGESVRLQLLAIDTDTLLQEHGAELRNLLNPVSDSSEPGAFRNIRRALRPLRTWEHNVEKRDAEGVFYDTLRLGRQKPGVYVVSARGEKTEALGWVMVTDLALVTKSAEHRITACTVDLVEGRPVAGSEIRVFAGQSVAGHAATDARGLAELRVPGSEELTAVARRGDSLAYVRLWRGGGEEPQKYRVFTYTDRPVYRPGRRVYFKGIARRMQGAGYAVPAARSAGVELTDEQNTAIWSGSVDLNERGSFDGRFDLPAAAHGGSYNLTVSIDGEEHSDGFAVASYRKPEWKVEVATPRPRCVRGDVVPVTVQAQYYFGSPVADGKARYTVYRTPYWRYWYGEDAEDAGLEEDQFRDEGGEVVAEGNLATDDAGSVKFDFPTALAKDQDRSLDYQYRIEVEVSDASDRIATGTGRVVVSPGEMSLQARSLQYLVAPKQSAEVVAQLTDMNDRPVSGAAVSAAASVQRTVAGKSRTEWLADQRLTTDARGEVRLAVTPGRTGLVDIRFSTKDQRGNTVEAAADVWCTTAEGDDELPQRAALSVIPDKKVYRIGDTAQILINTATPGPTALLTVEAESVLTLKQVPLTKKSTVVRLPVLRDYEPNVFVHVCFVKNKEFAASEARLNINTDAHRLKVTVRSDREVYHPRDTAAYTIRTTDARGRPVPAECSFGLVDESVYAIREDRPKALWQAFYPRRRNSVDTEFSFPTVYLGDADKDGPGETVRRNFPDTAAWEPVVRTDRSGQATVRVRLPDNLTTWRATVVAHTPLTEVGRATDTVQATRELVLRLQTPRVFTEGDRLTVSALAHNYTSQPRDVTVRLAATGAQIVSDPQKRVRVEPGRAERVEWELKAAAPGKAVLTAVAAAGAYSDGVELAVPVQPFVREQVVYRAGDVSGETASEEFGVDPDSIGGQMELHLSPTLAGAMLGALDYLATYPHGCTEQTLSSFLPNLAIHSTLKGLGLRRPELEEKLPAMVQAGLLRLYHYQHDDGGWGWWEYDRTDPWMTGYVLLGLQSAREAGCEINEQIYRNGLQHAGEMAQKNKLGSNEAMLLAWALARGKAARRAAPLLDRLRDSGSRKVTMRALRFRSLGYGLLALAATRNPDDRRLAESLMRGAWDEAVSQNGLAHWEEVRKHRWDWDVPEDAESTAVLLRAALQLTPEHPMLPDVARWLLLQRNGPKWQSTRDTAWILLALGEYLKARRELQPAYRLTVMLNGKQIHTEEVSPADALREETVVRLPIRDLSPRNRLDIRKEGEGAAYYALQVAAQVRAPRFAPESTVPGLTIQREYYRMRTQKDAQGRVSVVPEGKPVTSVRVGDRLMVRLKLHTDHRLDYLMLQDPIPAGFEVQDRGEVGRYEWDSWWSHTDVRDDRVNYFIRTMDPGDHEIEYYVRPEMSGAIRLLPAVLSDMYIPSTRAATPDMTLEVRR